jgi:hypothetical protein
VWLLPSPADLLPGLTAGASEVSRFSCMKFLGVPGVFDYAGSPRDLENTSTLNRGCSTHRLTDCRQSQR